MTGTPQELSVGALSDLIGRTLEESLRGPFRVMGEIANLSKRGHWYFSIKDARAVLPCVMWQSDAGRVAFAPKEGDAVVVTGKIGHYGPQGKTQLYATKMEPQGVGALELRFQQLVTELRAKGYFEDARKKPLPTHPRRVAVVTSATSAALQDVLKTARERRASVEFVVVDVRVQGEGAAEEVARALRALDRERDALLLDAIIVTRGGGSREDLWAFNERVVAEAAFALRVPLIAAIGHEVDTSVIELVADRRASTPTQAVMLLLPDMAALYERHERLARDLRNAMRWSLQARRERVARLERKPALQSPTLRLAEARRSTEHLGGALRGAMSEQFREKRLVLERISARLTQHAPAARAALARATIAAFGPRLSRAATQYLARERVALLHLERRLRSSGPQETLARGYAIVSTADGALVRSVQGVAPGSSLVAQLADGRLEMRVASVVEQARDDATIGREAEGRTAPEVPRKK